MVAPITDFLTVYPGALFGGLDHELTRILRRYVPGSIKGGAIALLSWIFIKLAKQLHFCIKPLPFPGPKGSPICGMAFKLDPKKALTSMSAWVKEFGETISFRVFSKTFVVTKNHDTLQQIFRDSSEGLFVRQFNTLGLLPESGIFLTHGQAWREGRRRVDPILAETNVRGLVPAMSQMSRRLVNVLSAMSDCAGQVHDWEPHGLLQLAALDFTFATHFGKDFNFLSPLDTNGAADREYTLRAFQDFLTGFDFILKHQALGPLLQNRYPNKLSQQVAKFYSSVAKVETSAREIIEQRKKELSEGAEPKCTVLDKLIAEKRLDLTWNLITFTLSGGTSVPSNLEWFLYLMCINQDAQKKARAEVDALGKDPTDNDDLDKLRYVEACVLETLRMNNSTPGPLPYLTTAPYTIEGRELEAGTVLIMMTGEAMKSKIHGGEEFRPEGWFVPGTGDIDRQKARNHWAFTGSPRRCPGQYLAMKECIVMAATILRHFDDIHLSDGCHNVGETTFINRIPSNLRINMKSRQR